MSNFDRFATATFGVRNTNISKSNSFLTGVNLSLSPIKTISFIVPKGTINGQVLPLIENPNKMLILGLNVTGATGTEVIGLFASGLVTSAGGFDNNLGGNVFNAGIFSDKFYIRYNNSATTELSNNVTIEVVIQFI
jgi:hypothetical protein